MKFKKDCEFSEYIKVHVTRLILNENIIYIYYRGFNILNNPDQ